LPWPVGAEEVEVPTQVPAVVLEAQRRARWLELLERSETHRIDLARVPTLGSRLGSGREVKELGYGGRAEAFGGTLLLVGREEPDSATAGRYLDISHASKLVNVSPTAYAGLACCLERESGEPLGLGVVSSYDPADHVLEVKSPAVVPAPVRQVRFGGFRVDAMGREGPALPSWSL
jgi:polynucleotide 5'-kinase involved in rRNA processing